MRVCECTVKMCELSQLATLLGHPTNFSMWSGDVGGRGGGGGYI